MLESAVKLNDLLGAINDALGLVDQELNIVWANEVMKRTFDPDIIGKKCSAICHPETVPCAPDSCVTLRAFKSAGSHENEVQMVSPQGTAIYFHCTATSAVRDHSGYCTAVLLVLQDITERKRHQNEIELKNQELEEANKVLALNEKRLTTTLYDLQVANDELKNAQRQLVQSEKMAMVGQLSAGIAHEIKNPLANIVLSIEGLSESIADPNPKCLTYLQVIQRASKRMQGIITRLLDFSRYSEADIKEENLPAIITAAITFVQSSAALKHIEFRCEFTQEEIIVRADSILLQQVFTNLFNNAIDAMADGGNISVKTFLSPEGEHGPGRFVTVEVADAGEGMSEEVLAKVFDPFFTTKGRGKGTGLGLSVVYMIIDRHKGKIAVDSIVGKGTKFTIQLPLAPRVTDSKPGVVSERKE